LRQRCVPAEKDWAEEPLKTFSVGAAPQSRRFCPPPLPQPYHLHSGSEYAAGASGNFLQEKGAV